MIEIQAVMGRSQLERLPGMNEARRDVAQRYLDALEEIPALEWVGDPSSIDDHAFHLFVVRVTEDYPLTREALYDHLSDNDTPPTRTDGRTIRREKGPPRRDRSVS